MPKAFTQSQKDLVRLILIKKGREFFIKYGLKKTSVDDLVRAAGIAKGSFYTFFESKEALFLAVHEASEERLRTDLMRKLDEITKPDEKLHVFLKSSFQILEEDPPVLAVFGRGELEGFPGFVSSKQYEEHYHDNIAFMKGLIQRWQEEGIIRQVDTEVAGNLIDLAFYLPAERDSRYRNVCQSNGYAGRMLGQLPEQDEVAEHEYSCGYCRTDKALS